MAGAVAVSDYDSASDRYSTVKKSPGRPADPVRATTAAPVEEFLGLLARAVRQFRTYPAASPLCVDAIDACHKGLGMVESERLHCIVSPRELLVSGAMVGRGTLIEQELARRLHEAHVATLDIERGASPRDLSRFCSDLVAHRDGPETLPLGETLAEHGVDRIVLGAAYQPEVFDVAAAPAVRRSLVAQERQRREAEPMGPAAHLYPPDKGWVRTDPGLPLGPLALQDLAILVEDPASLASMLSSLAGDLPHDAATPGDALERRFGDVSRLFSSLEPRLARVMFAKLAGAVLALDSHRRQRLLSSTILPGLIDGGSEGHVLGDFPDVELADALSLLLDLETAAPELLSIALDRLKLSDERRDQVAPLLESRIRARAGGQNQPQGESALDERTRQLLKVATGERRSFVDFAAFDLAMDPASASVIDGAGGAIAGTDPTLVQLTAVCQLVRIEPNPEVVDRLLQKAGGLLGTLESDGRWTEMTRWLRQLREHATALREPRPDVAAAIAAGLTAFFDQSRVRGLLALHEAGGERSLLAQDVMSAAGPILAPPLLAYLEARGGEQPARRVVQLLCAHADVLAPALAECLPGAPLVSAVAATRALGLAGRGYEPIVAAQLSRDEEPVVREALRALARIGSDDAAAAVAAHLRRCAPGGRAAAEEALGRFDPEASRPYVRELLHDRQFVVEDPDAAIRLLDRAARARTDGLEPALEALAPLRFRFWNPGLMRVGRRSQALLHR
jgi:hypothetical protein